MEQLERIREMEERLDKGKEVLSAIEEAIRNYQDYQEDLKKLESYYSSSLWLQDYEDDEEGRLPGDLKRGVLSEDELFDFLQRNDELLEKIDNLPETKHLPHLYDSGYVNAILEYAGKDNERMGRSSAIAYRLEKDQFLSEIKEMFDVKEEILQIVTTSFENKLREWFGETDIAEMLEAKLGKAETIYEFKEQSILEKAGGEYRGFSELFFIEDGFAAVFKDIAFLFLMGNCE